VDLRTPIEDENAETVRGVWWACDGPEAYLRIDHGRRVVHGMSGTHVLLIWQPSPAFAGAVESSRSWFSYVCSVASVATPNVRSWLAARAKAHGVTSNSTW
jgi:hypothetical protein